MTGSPEEQNFGEPFVDLYSIFSCNHRLVCHSEAKPKNLGFPDASLSIARQHDY